MSFDANSIVDFHAASREVLRFLHSRLGFSLWMVTRTCGNDWIVLNVHDHAYNVQTGDVFKWTDSFCSRMVQGLGPCIAPSSADVPAYASAPIGQQVPIGAYIGMPLTNFDGTLFGTLCAIDPSPQPDDLTKELPLLELLSRLLGTVLAHEMRTEAEMRRAERAEQQAEVDALTGLFNRRGWDRLMEVEESRCTRYGHPASVIYLDLDCFKTINDTFGHERGDELLVKASEALRSECRDGDIIARLGGDEFAVLAVNADQTSADGYVSRLESALRRIDIPASIASADRSKTKSLRAACVEADQKMYERKRGRYLNHSVEDCVGTAFPSTQISSQPVSS